jgi:tetratricopeptide (TPR) repeat protein
MSMQMSETNTSKTPSTRTPMESGIDSSERYERGLTLRKAGLFKQAIEEFEEATKDRAYALKAYAQIGLCHKSSARFEEAVLAFRKALKSPHASTKETVQILYVLGRTLQTLGRIAETMEVYRWIRREDPDYRDVEQRIKQLSTRRTSSNGYSASSQRSWVGGVIRSWQDLLRTPK